MAKTDKPATTSSPNDLVAALVEAINVTKPEVKKTISNRKRNTPWDNKDGTPKPKLKRKMHQHGLPITEARTSAEDILLLNKIKVGTYANGLIKVVRRKDQGIDIDYPVKTAAQRLKLVHLGIVSLTTLLQYLITEAANPKKIDSEEVEE